MECKNVFHFLLLLIYIYGICDGMTDIDRDEYCRMYGYTQDRMPGTGIPATPEIRKLCLQRFQNFNSLEVSGTADTNTIALMKKPRCGCNDLVMPEKKIMMRTRRDLKQFKPVEFNQGPGKWGKTRLSYTFLRGTGFTNQLDQSRTRTEIARAFKVWTDVSSLEVSYTDDESRADIIISFERRDHGDGSSFDGNGLVLAHAFYPEHGIAHFDDDERWVINNTGVDLFTVAAHEFGHSLGLAHSSNGDALMAPYYAGYKANYQLHWDDIRGIQSLYGSPSNTPDPPLTTLPPPTRPPRPTQRPRPTQTPTQTRGPPITTPPPPTTPDICRFEFKGVMKDDNGDILAFNSKGDVIRMTLNDGFIEQVKSSDIFPEAPENFDDVINVPSAGTVFFRRALNWKYQIKPGTVSERDLTVRAYIPGARRHLREKIKAVFATSQNRVYIIGTYFVQEFSAQTMEIVPGTYGYVSSKFPGVPQGLDAALAISSREIYFFKGSEFWRFDLGSRRLLETRRKIAPRFIGRYCN
ncbi:stromelysin-1-like [Mizuhopecten yessoensis]|uniref:Matrix metalloproteinase-16 n=1 Tax=Mizuhopecten yessoensis TaxID=6573 RepID=A0A210R6T8_MIZYE|nr:stromelysin-1-like [Mizuhopecten yessoensis]OWF56648.1 Matrix metalloproteinase-16 [Mizuhopecten yessoensis]